MSIVGVGVKRNKKQKTGVGVKRNKKTKTKNKKLELE